MTTAVLAPTVEFDADLIRKLNRQGPRYTSYPTADRFNADFGYGDYLQAVTARRRRNVSPALSFYIHVPFCATVCYYCACNKVVTKNREKAATYLDYLKREIAMQGQLFAGMNRVEQLHFGGGTPTYFSDQQMQELLDHLWTWFKPVSDELGEYSIEIDPRTVSRDRMFSLRAQGFNRVSLGVQDFDEAVQRAVNRVQPEEVTREAVTAARDANFRSVSIDLIYGLPLQTLSTMAQTLDKVIDISPDRIAIYNYAHLPHLFKPQRRIDESELPDANTKLDMLALCISRLCNAGYVYIGMDHFAKPTDDLAKALFQGRLHRNFQGYSTHADTDLVACGVSAIGSVGATYCQNAKTLDDYYARLDNNELPIVRGTKINMDDALRRSIIQMLMCNFELSVASVEMAYPITFNEYFAAEIVQLGPMIEYGLMTMEDDWISITPKGRLLVRNICMVFDRYLARQLPTARYSKTI
jgi:oxygen-independent coproporphyrinogen-3 oxidase